MKNKQHFTTECCTTIKHQRLFEILHCVQTLNELPDDITVKEKGVVQMKLVEPFIDSDGSYSYFLTQFGEAMICALRFHEYDDKNLSDSSTKESVAR